MKEDTLSTKEMIVNIKSMRKLAMSLIKNEKAYNLFLNQLLNSDYFSGKAKIPTLKILAETSKLKTGVVRAFVEEIYHDLVFDYDAKPPFAIKKICYEFYIRGWGKKRLSVDFVDLPIVPRIGEELSLPFFTAYFGTSSFFVEKIKHEFEEDVQTICLWLKQGSYNLYWHFRRDQAEEEEELHFTEFFSGDDLELKRKLKVGRWKYPQKWH